MGFDYSNTGIFSRNEQDNNVVETNNRLVEMYRCFYRHMKEKAEKQTKFFAGYYNGVQLLTCFDSYMRKKNKVMCFGKEANTDEGSLFLCDGYQTDKWYGYDYAIAHINDEDSHIPKRHCPQTFYLKTRKALSGFDEGASPDDREKQTLSIINNNLNKTSFKGKRPVWDDRLTDIVYSGYEYDGFFGNIYLHELNILRPTHLVFISGKGYTAEIKRAFGAEFLSMILPLINSLRLTGKGSDRPSVPVSEPLTLSGGDVEKLWKIKNYPTLRIIYAFHPSARLSTARDRYISELRDFVDRP